MGDPVTRPELEAVRDGLRERVDVHRRELDALEEGFTEFRVVTEKRLSSIESLLVRNNDLIARGIGAAIAISILIVTGALTVILFGPTPS